MNELKVPDKNTLLYKYSESRKQNALDIIAEELDHHFKMISKGIKSNFKILLRDVEYRTVFIECYLKTLIKKDYYIYIEYPPNKILVQLREDAVLRRLDTYPISIIISITPIKPKPSMLDKFINALSF